MVAWTRRRPGRPCSAARSRPSRTILAEFAAPAPDKRAPDAYVERLGDWAGRWVGPRQGRWPPGWPSTSAGALLGWCTSLAADPDARQIPTLAAQPSALGT